MTAADSKPTGPTTGHRRARRRRILAATGALVIVWMAGDYVLSDGHIMRLRPVCFDDKSFWGHLEIGGKMTEEFMIAYTGSMPERMGYSIWTWRREPFVTLSVWWDFDYRKNITYKSLHRLLGQRHGFDGYSDLKFGKVRVEGFDQRDPYIPTCDTVREIAIVGGKWSVSGPPITRRE